MKVRVYRKTGDLEYPEILVDELCTSESVGIEKGMCFLYDNIDKLVYDMEVRYSGLLKINDVVFIDDSSLGESFYARITGISISGDMNDGSYVLTQTLTLERSLDD